MHQQSRKERRGSIMTLTAVVLVAMLGFVALTVDVGVLQLTRTQLQAAADASALAAAGELAYRGSSDTSLQTHVRSVSSTIASDHVADGKAVKLVDADTVLGTWNTTTATFTELTGSQLPSANAVKVMCKCDPAHGNPVNFFFAPVLGVKNASVSATAIARIKPSPCGMIIGINSAVVSGSSYTDSYSSDGGAYSTTSSGSKGTVCSNGNITTSGSAVIKGD